MSNTTKKYASLNNLQTFKENADKLYATQTSLDEVNDTVLQKSQVQIVTQDVSEFVPTLKIQKISQKEYNQKTNDGTLEDDVMYLTPEDETGLGQFATKDELAEKADAFHIHDDRYYTEIEVDIKLENKSNITHNHDDVYESKGAADTALNSAKEYIDVVAEGKSDVSHTHAISDVTNLQTTLEGKVSVSRTVNGKTLSENITLCASDVGAADTEHTHDDRYYTQSEIDGKFAEKSDISHNHDLDYDTKGAASSALASAKEYTDTIVEGKSDTSHNHDSDYDTKGSADTALASAKTYTDTKTDNLISASAVDTKISTHNTSTSAHNDIRALITELTTKVNNFLDVDDTTTDQLSEVLTLIENNKGTLESLTTSKVNVSDIVNNLTTNSDSKVLSAAQGVAIKSLIDTLEEELDSHTHTIADVFGLQSALDSKAASSHGTHVSYSTTNPVMDGTASVGSASTVARSDHRHPTDTSRAAQTDLDALAEVVAKKADTSTLTSHTSNKSNPHGVTASQVGAYTKSEVDSALNGKAPNSHTHDDRYYTETEIDSKVATLNTAIEGKAASSHTHSISNITNLQSALDGKADSSHSHNYLPLSGGDMTGNIIIQNSNSYVGLKDTDGNISYLQTYNDGSGNKTGFGYSWVNSLKLDTSGNVYTVGSIYEGNTALSNKYATKSHTHDDRYYTETEIDSKVSTLQSAIDGKAAKATTLSGYGITNAYTKTEVDTTVASLNSAISGKADSSHSHDDRYYTESEINTKVDALNTAINGKAASGHTHSNMIVKLNSGTTEGTNMFTYNGSTAKTINITPASIGAQTAGSYASSNHNHNDVYYTETEIDTKVDSLQSAINGKAASSHTHTIANITNLQSSLDEKVPTSRTVNGKALNNNITLAKSDVGLGNVDNTADSTKSVKYATSAGSATKATQDASGNTITSTYETKTDASTKLTEAKTYADSAATNAANTVKNDLLNGAGGAYDTLKELGDLIDNNKDAIEALEEVASGKANKSHTHAITDVSGLQSALDGKAATSHGTHVSYSTTAPVMDGTASVGTASTVARSDHKHPTDTSRASQADLDALETVVAGKANSSHTHTIANITNLQSSLDGKANTSHGNHVPTTQTANNAVFLRNDNTWATVTPANIGAATSSHNHTVANITDLRVTADELNYVDGLTDNIQIQLDDIHNTALSADSLAGDAYSLADTANTNAAIAQTKANSAYTLAESKVDSLSDLGITATAIELNYVDGVTDNIQTQLDEAYTLAEEAYSLADTKADSSHTHSNYASTVTTSGSGNAITAISQSGNTITATKGATFLTSLPSHTHDDRYYTETEIDSKVSTLNTAINGKAASSHTHSISNITNLQSTLDGKANSSHSHSEYMTASNPTGTGSFSMNRKADTTVGSRSSVFGSNCEASGGYSHAEGHATIASGNNSHAEGTMTQASGISCHAEGSVTVASGNYSHAEGQATEAVGIVSHAAGFRTIANDYQYVIGKYNADTTAITGLEDTAATAGLFIVGIGSSESTRANGFRINPAGNAYGVGSYGTSGADYAEYFEWADGNVNNEDRRGRFVTLDGDKIRYATSKDDYILGVVSAEPTVVGDIQSEMWHNMYLKDIYGSKIVEVVEVEETTDENGCVIPAHTERRWVLNPDYNTDLEYVSREERPEWDAIGIVGKLVVVDDGTCQVNGYCYPNIDGIATASQDKTAYRVIERLDDNHIRIFIK